MTDKLTIEILCEMLKEQGLSCHTHYLHAFWWVGQKLYEAADNLDGTLTVGRLTPEQAIAATLDSGTYEEERIDELELKYMEAGHIIERLTAELENETCEVECFDDGVDEGMDGEWFSYAPPTWYLTCGHTAQGTEKPNFCQVCGKAVKR